MLKNLYIIGAGGFGREVAWLVERINAVEPTWNLKGFVDDNVTYHGTYVGGYPVVGGCEYLINSAEETWIVCAIGAAHVRKQIVEKFEDCAHLKFATIVDPSVIHSERVEIGEGTVICAGAIATVDIIIGRHVIINWDCVVGHDAYISDFVTLYPSVNISGCVNVGECSEVGTGTQIIQGKRIGTGTIIGAGAVVIRDMPDKCKAVGSPAKPIGVLD